MTGSDPAQPRYQALIQLLRTAEDLWNASRIFFDRWDLSPSQFNVLNLLYGNPNGLSQSDLSRQLIMHRSNATGLVDRLEKRALVRRESHPTDRRAYRVVITPDGAQLLNQIYPHYFAAADRVWCNMPDTSVPTFLLQLQELAQHATAVALTEAINTSPTPAPRAPRTLASQRPPSAHHSTPSATYPPSRRSSPVSSPVSPASDESSVDPLRTSDL